MDELSKRDADLLGVGDMTGPQLRMRVFQTEGLVAELALTLEEMVETFAGADTDRRQTESLDRAREVLTSVDERYLDLPSNDILYRCAAVLDTGWAWFGDLTDQAAEDQTGRCNRFMSAMENLAALVESMKGPGR